MTEEKDKQTPADADAYNEGVEDAAEAAAGVSIPPTEELPEDVKDEPVEDAEEGEPT